MSTYAVLRIVVLLLVLVPLASAVLVPLFGPFARRVALVVLLIHLGLTAAVVAIAVPALGFRAEEKVSGDEAVYRFRPEFVPGDPGGRGQADSSEARTTWTLFRLSDEAVADRPGPNVQLYLGVDGLNLWLVALAAVLMPTAVLVSWDAVTERPGAFYGWLFLLQAGLIGVFLSFDVILFYIFFELTLIPAFFLIGYWGIGSGRRDAARKFFLYTLAGSLLTLLGVIGVVVTNPTPVHPTTGARLSLAVYRAPGAVRGGPQGDWVLAQRGPVTFSLPDLMGNVQVWADAPEVARRAVADAETALAAARARRAGAEEVPVAEGRLRAIRDVQSDIERAAASNRSVQFWLFVALMAGFLVKVPVWPFHTWLPGAYGEAPTGAIVLVSAVMSKLGTFGILRLVLPLVPDAAIRYGLPAVGTLAAFGIVYAALCAYSSRDIKLVFAYSSVSHLGFLVLGLFAFNKEGLTGATLHMVNHGLSTGALFAALGFLMERYRTTDREKFGGLMGRFPHYAVLVFVLCLASIGLPGLNNFVSEMLMLGGLFDARNSGANWPLLATVAAVGIFLSSWYTFTMLKRVFFNAPQEPEAVVPVVRDVTRREFLAFGSLAALCVVLGLLPQPLIETMRADVRVLSIIGDKARARAEGVPYQYVEDEPRPPAPAPPAADPTTKGGKGGGPPGGKGGGPPGGGKGGPLGGGKGPPQGKGPPGGNSVKGPMGSEK
jgi:NADH-quinone oxidoreductase subunit M